MGINHGAPVAVVNPGNTVQHSHPSHLDAQHTKDNMNSAYSKANGAYTSHPESVNRIRSIGGNYRNEYQSRIRERGEYFKGLYSDQHYRYYYSGYYKHGFFGGYWYPCRPYYDIDTYFVYPMVFWFYVATPEPEVYEGYYPVEYPTNPIEPFAFAGAFYPTDTLRDFQALKSVACHITYWQTSELR